jgi:hypothetical protein
MSVNVSLFSPVLRTQIRGRAADALPEAFSTQLP